MSQKVRSRLESKKFPVFSLFNREFDAETGSQQTATSATESGMFPYILEKR